MRKKLYLGLFGKTLLFFLSFICFTGGSLFAQIQGGGGIIHVTGDPDLILATQNVDINEGNICFDRAAQIVYFFDPTGTAGVNQWNGVAVSSFTDTDTRLTNPTVSGGNLVFDILDVITNTTSGTVSVAILDIAPVQDVVGGGDVTVTDDGAGTYTVSFTEALTSLSVTVDTLFYTDEDGTVNSIVLPSSDGSDTQVQDAGDISVTGTGTVADPYVVSFTEALTSLSLTVDTLFYTDEDGTVNSIVLPSSDGSDTQVQDAGDITVTGTGTVADPYIVDFSETTTTLTITVDTLFYTDEDGTVNSIVLPSSDGSDTQVQDAGDITVTGTGTVADPYIVDFSETTTTLTITADTLSYTDEDGTVNNITLPTSDGSDTQVTGSNSIVVTGTGTAADPYVIQVAGAHAAGNSGGVPVTDGLGNLTWTDVVTGAAILSTGALQLTFTDGSTAIVDLDNAPKVSDMSELSTAVTALTTAGHPSGIAIADEGNTFGLPATSQVGVIFFIKQ